MAFDDKELGRLFPTRTGEAQGTASENRTLVSMGGANTTKTKIVNNPDGSQTICKTRNGNPEFVTTKNKVDFCVKGPLVEIAFKYVNPTFLTGYRRWYGEPHPVLGTPEKVIQYEFTSDGLMCMEARKLHKICFEDGNANKVDFLFAQKPKDITIPAASLPATVQPDNTEVARFAFTEGKYTEREWHTPIELANIGWAFAGPKIAGVPSPEPASAVKFFISRLKAITFRVTDATAEKFTSLVRWEFATKITPDRLLGPSTTACTNQNARELSFYGRHFFTPNTDGNMDKLVMSVADGGPSFEVQFKKPGSFIAAIDPEGATGNARPADVERAIDLCEFSAIGNPYHGLFWWELGQPKILYTDNTKTAQWPFAPSTKSNNPDNGVPSVDHKYYNFTGADPLDEANQKKLPSGIEAMYIDAFVPAGQWWLKDGDTTTWGNMHYTEQLYKDPAGTVWIVEFVVSVVLTVQYIDIRLRRKYGILGTDWRYGAATNSADRSLGTIAVDYTAEGFSIYTYPFVTNAPNGTRFLCGLRQLGSFYSGVTLRAAWNVDLSGTGALKTDVPHGIVEGQGISAAITRRDLSMYNITTVTTTPTMEGSISFPSVTVGDITTTTPTYTASTGDVTKVTTTIELLDIQWVNGQWADIFWQKEDSPPRYGLSLSGVVPQLVQHFTGYDTQIQDMEWDTQFTSTPTTLRAFLARGAEVVWEAIYERQNTWTPVHRWQPFNLPLVTTGGVLSYTIRDDLGTGNSSVTLYPVGLTAAARPAYFDGFTWVILGPGYTPMAWSVKDLAGYALGTLDPVPLIYRDGLVSVDPYYYQWFTDATYTHGCSARIGWAYDYRTKELITIPHSTVAYFI